MSVESWTRWRAERDRTLSEPYGVASLDRTAWLDAAWRSVDEVPGTWRLDDDVAEGSLDERIVRIAPGEEADVDGLRLRHFARGGGHALRVFDPDSPNRTTLTGIDVFPFDSAWVVSGTFHPAAGDSIVDVTTADGSVRPARLAGAITLPTPKGHTQLTVTLNADDRLSAVLADATSGVESYRFRFLEVGEVVGTEVIVDFNRAYLPPCAFSPEYICPLPLPGNRWSIPVRAGERTALRTGDDRLASERRPSTHRTPPSDH